MQRLKIKDPYTIINLVFSFIVLSIIVYSFLFTPEKNNYPVHAFTGFINDRPSISTGLSRSFSEIVRLRLDLAKQYNLYGLRIFLFLLIQMVLRIFFILITVGGSITNIKTIVRIDILVSVILFLYCFWPFISAI
jgi:hypothetical protein